MSNLKDFTPAEIVKSYTKLITISEYPFVQLLASIRINPDVNSLEEIVQVIIRYCKEVDSQGNVFSLVDNVENECCIINIEDSDTATILIKEFFETIKSYSR